jgi:hypothetical protein
MDMFFWFVLIVLFSCVPIYVKKLFFRGKREGAGGRGEKWPLPKKVSFS